jgi:hypothetical protein
LEEAQVIAAMLFLYLTPYNCTTLPPADARELVESLGYQVLAMAEMQNRRAGVPPWWLQTTTEEEE